MQNLRRVDAKFHPDFQEKVGTKISIGFLICFIAFYRFLMLPIIPNDLLLFRGQDQYGSRLHLPREKKESPRFSEAFPLRLVASRPFKAILVSLVVKFQTPKACAKKIGNRRSPCLTLCSFFLALKGARDPHKQKPASL